MKTFGLLIHRQLKQGESGLKRLGLIEFGGKMDMTKIFSKFRIFSVFLVGFLLPTLSFAGIRDDRPSEVQGLYTLLFGYGVSLAHNLGDHLAFGGTFYAATIEGEGETEENNETVKADFSTSELFLRLYPFEGAGFYISGSSVFRNWKITVKGYDTSIGGGPQGNYTITAEWPNTGYAYGLGYHWIANFGLSGGVFLGALSGGDPELKGETDAVGVTQEQVDAHIKEIEEKEKFGEKYNTVALVRFSIGYNF